MSENRALVARQPAGGGALITSLEDAARMAKFVADSKLFSCSNPAEAMVKIVAGMEMGFPAIASMSDIHIIEGKPSVGAHLMAAAIRRSGKYDFEIREHTDEVCSLAFFQMKNGQMKEVGIVTTTLQQAKDNGWTVTQSGKEKITWRTKSKNMLFARSISDGYKWYCPDLTGGMLVYDRDEIEPDTFNSSPSVSVVDDAKLLSHSPYAKGIDEHSLRQRVRDLCEKKGLRGQPLSEHLLEKFRVNTIEQLNAKGLQTFYDELLGQVPSDENGYGDNHPLKINEDGSLSDPCDELQETRQRVNGLLHQLKITEGQLRKKLIQSYDGAIGVNALDLPDMQRLERELLEHRARRVKQTAGAN